MPTTSARFVTARTAGGSSWRRGHVQVLGRGLDRRRLVDGVVGGDAADLVAERPPVPVGERYGHGLRDVGGAGDALDVREAVAEVGVLVLELHDQALGALVEHRVE